MNDVMEILLNQRYYGLSMRLLLVIVLLAGPTLAEPNASRCDELWFARNAMMDRAGYCFESPLGQAIFDNADCTTSDPDLSVSAFAMAEQIARNEAALGCFVDTDRTALLPHAVQNMDQRLLLEAQPPVTNEWQAEFSCIGYRGEPLSLHAAPDASSTVLSKVVPGSIIDFDRVVLVEDGTFRIASQIVINGADWNPDEGDFIEGWHGYPDGHYWIFVNVRDGHDADSRIGWVFLPAQAGGHCENAAG